MSWPPGWRGHLGKQVAESKCVFSHSPLSCSLRIMNSFTSEHIFESLCHCCTGRKVRWKESRRLELWSHFICVASGESSSLLYPFKKIKKENSKMLLYLMAILLTSCTDKLLVFLVLLFLNLSTASFASFPLSSTSVPEERHEEYFTAALKCGCPARGNADKC